MQTKVEKISILQAIKLKIEDYKILVKNGLTSFLVICSVIAYLIVANSPIDWVKVLVFAIGGYLVTGAANALNQVLEKEYDGIMNRTKVRPLVTGRMLSSEAVLAAGLMMLVGVGLLSTFNALTGVLAMLSLISYAFIYTPLKRVSSISVFVGAIPGALPMLIGSAAAEGHLSWLGFTLFSIQFLWQFPHFWAIAWLGHEDYTRAGYRMLPSENLDGNVGFYAFVYALFLIPVGLLPMYMGATGLISAFVMTVIGIVFSYYGWRLHIECTKEAARKLMFASFFYLPIALIVLVLDKL
jgi:heme o synthase